MKKWTNPTIDELTVLETRGGTQNGSEKNGKGEKENGGWTRPDDPITPAS